jgi:hypothetical protein
MSDYQAIGAVSTTLQRLLKDRMELPSSLPGLQVTVSTPSPDPGNGQSVEEARVNLFLYQVTENGALKNQEIPGQEQPPLSLNLHYLITAYGTMAEAEGNYVNETLAHYLLGSAMRVLHDNPVITDQLTTVREPMGEPILDPVLIGAFEQVSISLDPVSLESLSDVWSALTLPYRLSAAYAVSVVQIESQQAPRYPKPVGKPPDAGPRLTVVTFSAPVIDRLRIRRQEPPHLESTAPYARIGDTLMLLGSNLTRDVQVQIGALTLPPTISDGQRLEVAILDDAGLQPGAQPVSGLRDFMVGDPPEPRPGLRSNQAVFMLVPRVETVSLAGNEVTIAGTRLFMEAKPCQTIVGNEVIQGANYLSAMPTQIRFTLPALDPGTYAVQVRVNGAESIDEWPLIVP